MSEPREVADDRASGYGVDPSVESRIGPDERRLRPLAWLSQPADRQHDLQAWLDYRSTMIGSARAERWRR